MSRRADIRNFIKRVHILCVLACVCVCLRAFIWPLPVSFKLCLCGCNGGKFGCVVSSTLVDEAWQKVWNFLCLESRPVWTVFGGRRPWSLGLDCWEWAWDDLWCFVGPVAHSHRRLVLMCDCNHIHVYIWVMYLIVEESLLKQSLSFLACKLLHPFFLFLLLFSG